MRKKNLILVMAFAVGSVVLFAGNVWAFSLPYLTPTVNLPNLGIPPASLHNDFYAYSLPILALNYSIGTGGAVGTGPGNPYYVNSTSGAIKEDIVIATGASGNPVNTNYPGMDDAYPTPNGQHGSPAFNTITTMPGGVADPNGTGNFTGDVEHSWDMTLESLLGYLGRNDTDPLNNSNLVFFWNNNQVNSGSSANQNLYGWGRIAIIGGGTTQYFYFSDEADGVFTEFTDPTSPGSFVLSPGQIDIVSTIGSTTLNHNLGANQAAYALYSKELNDGLEGWYNNGNGYTTMQIDIRLRALNNGYEQLFIQRTDSVVNEIIPEPTTMLLLGSGLLGLAGFGFRKKRKA